MWMMLCVSSRLSSHVHSTLVPRLIVTLFGWKPLESTRMTMWSDSLSTSTEETRSRTSSSESWKHTSGVPGFIHNEYMCVYYTSALCVRMVTTWNSKGIFTLYMYINTTFCPLVLCLMNDLLAKWNVPLVSNRRFITRLEIIFQLLRHCGKTFDLNKHVVRGSWMNR